jgi:hypothetical protein
MNYKYLILLIIFIVAGYHSQAVATPRAWVRIGQTETVSIYVDRNSIENTASGKRAWEMQDLKMPDSDGVSSRLYLNEFDCKLKLHRISQLSSYSGPRLSGRKVAEVSEPGYWRKIPSTGLFVVGYILHCVQ